MFQLEGGASAMKHIGTKTIRDVGGELLSKTVVDAGCARIETIRRRITGDMGWHFRQPQPVLFWYRRGAARRLRGSLDGRRIDHAFAGNLALFPADMEIDGEFRLDVSAVEYTVVFFQTPFVETRGGNCLDRAKLGFKHPLIARGLEELCQEAQDPDTTFDMLAEGWAIQTMAHLHRVGDRRSSELAKGGLSASSLRRLDEYVTDNLDRPISLADLSNVTGLSKRHFIRAFAESSGQTPHRYLVSQRIEKAKQLLANSTGSITEIGLAVGFSHAQHFSNKFKALTGLTPSRYRELRV
jgi:AraC family transcriptional regulator